MEFRECILFPWRKVKDTVHCTFFLLKLPFTILHTFFILSRLETTCMTLLCVLFLLQQKRTTQNYSFILSWVILYYIDLCILSISLLLSKKAWITFNTASSPHPSQPARKSEMELNSFTRTHKNVLFSQVKQAGWQWHGRFPFVLF